VSTELAPNIPPRKVFSYQSTEMTSEVPLELRIVVKFYDSVMCVCVCVCTREPISVGSYVCTRRTLPVALLGPNLRPNRVFHWFW